MKLITKIAIYALALVTFTLTSCTAKSEPAQPLTNFTASVACENEEYTVVHSGNSLTTITYHTPAQLDGLTYSYKNNAVSVNYLSLSYLPSNNTLPVDNNASKLYEMLKSISTDNCYILSTTKNTVTYSLPLAEMVCDFNTGRINEIKPKNSEKIYIFNYQE